LGRSLAVDLLSDRVARDVAVFGALPWAHKRREHSIVLGRARDVVLVLGGLLDARAEL
jgi:hypothetical protein